MNSNATNTDRNFRTLVKFCLVAGLIVVIALVGFQLVSANGEKNQSLVQERAIVTHKAGELVALHYAERDGFWTHVCVEYTGVTRNNDATLSIAYRDASGHLGYFPVSGNDASFAISSCGANEIYAFKQALLEHRMILVQREQIRRFKAVLKGLKDGDKLTVQVGNDPGLCIVFASMDETTINEPDFARFMAHGRYGDEYSEMLYGTETSVHKGCDKAV